MLERERAVRLVVRRHGHRLHGVRSERPPGHKVRGRPERARARWRAGCPTYVIRPTSVLPCVARSEKKNEGLAGLDTPPAVATSWAEAVGHEKAMSEDAKYEAALRAKRAVDDAAYERNIKMAEAAAEARFKESNAELNALVVVYEKYEKEMAKQEAAYEQEQTEWAETAAARAAKEAKKAAFEKARAAAVLEEESRAAAKAAPETVKQDEQSSVKSTVDSKVCFGMIIIVGPPPLS